MQSDNPMQKHQTVYSAFYPLILVVVTILVNTAFQSSQIFQEKENLSILRSNQEKALGESRKIRTQFDAITTGTAKLAAQGNQNASLVLVRLKKMGISVNLPPQLLP